MYSIHSFNPPTHLSTHPLLPIGTGMGTTDTVAGRISRTRDLIHRPSWRRAKRRRSIKRAGWVGGFV